ncbi:MAG: response regulator [Chloroflexi bacterium]|nr:response regulator [Chloroflexota bacterium]
MSISVLTIDDDPATSELLIPLLIREGYDVMTANSGEQGLKMIREQPVDIVLLDWSMPGLDGEKLCQAVREFSRVPILALSALDKPGAVARALDSGADDYLVKPVSSGRLMAHINKLARQVRTTGQLRNSAACPAESVAN